MNLTLNQVPENNIINEPWYVNFEVLRSYLDYQSPYVTALDSTKQQHVIKWFNLDLKVPQTTDKEAKEMEECVKHQVKLGILQLNQVQRAMQQNQKSQPVYQQPEQVIDNELAKTWGLILTPAFISMWQGSPTPTDKLMTVVPNAPQFSQTPAQKVEAVKKDPVNILIEQEKLKKEKFNFDIKTGKKIGKNDPCPCGSGRKYKVCHGRGL